MPNYNLGSVEGEIRIGYNGQGATAARADIENLVRTATGQELLLRVGGDVTRLRAALDIARAELARLEGLSPSVEVQAQIERARANIGELEGEIRRIEDVEIDVDADTSAAEGAFDSLKAKALVAGAAAGTVLSSAISTAIERQDATANLQVQLGLTADEASRYGELAGRLYSNNFGGSMEEVNTALKGIQTNIGDLGSMSEAEIETISQSALGLATTFNVDVNEATRAAGQLMKTGLAPDAKTAFDIIANGFQNGANGSDDLLETINEYSVQFQKLGIDGPTAMNLLSQGLQGGARDADLVADAFKEFSLRAIDGSTGTVEAYQAIGLNAEDTARKIAAGGPTAQAATKQVMDSLNAMTDPIARNAAGVALFGTQWEDLGGAVNSLNLGTATQGLQDVAGTMDQVNATMGETAAAKIETAKRGFEGLTQQLVTMDGPMGDIVAGATALGPEMLTMGAAVVTAAATAGPAILAMIISVGSYLISMGAAVLSTLIGWATMAASAVASAAVIAAAWLMANPIVLIIAALVAIIAVIIYYWDEIWAFLVSVWENIKTTVSDGINAVSEWITRVGQNISNTWNSFWEGVWNYLVNLWNRIKTTVSSGIEDIKGWINTGLQWIHDTWVNIWNTITTFVSDLIQKVIGLYRDGMDRMGQAIGTGIDNAIRFFRELPGNILRAVGNLGMLLYNAGRDVVMGIWNGIVGMGNWLRDSIWGWVRSVIPGPVLEVLGIASPSKFMRDEVGKMIPAGIMVGMEANSGSLIASAKKMTEDLTAAASMGLDVPSLTMAATTTVQGVGAPALAAAAGTIGGPMTKTLQIGSVSLQVTGNLDPTNPVQWRAAIESIQEELVNVEASYR